MDKIEDFGVHANAYYQLKVEIYKTKLDEQLLSQLWNKYWVVTLSQSLATVRPCTGLSFHHAYCDCCPSPERDILTRPQNRAYATSQMTDLHHKLSAVSTEHPAKLKKGDKGQLEDEPTALNKVVEDR